MTRRLHLILVAFAIGAGQTKVDGQEVAVEDLGSLVVGVGILDVSEAQEVFRDEKITLPVREGVVVSSVPKYSPAVGLSALDLITYANGTRVTSRKEFTDVVTTLKPQQKCKIVGFRYSEPKIKGYPGTWKRLEVEVTPVTKREFIIAAMREQVDKVEGVSFFYHRDSPKFLNSNSELYAYFSAEAGKARALRLNIQYVAGDWLFIQKFTIKADDKSFVITPTRDRLERDFSSGKIWEWYDTPVSRADREMLVAIADADEVILRCEGDKYQKDRTLSAAEKDRIRGVLNAFKAMGGE